MFLLCCSYVALIHEWEGNQVEKKTKQKQKNLTFLAILKNIFYFCTKEL